MNKYKIFKEEDCPNANYIMENGFYLPSGNNITNDEIDFICDEIKKSPKIKMNFAVWSRIIWDKKSSAIKNSKIAKLSCINDINLTNAKKASETLKVPIIEYSDILKKSEIDVICVCTQINSIKNNC